MRKKVWYRHNKKTGERYREGAHSPVMYYYNQKGQFFSGGTKHVIGAGKWSKYGHLRRNK